MNGALILTLARVAWLAWCTACALAMPSGWLAALLFWWLGDGVLRLVLE